jgi:hypothetical protein
MILHGRPQVSRSMYDVYSSLPHQQLVKQWISMIEKWVNLYIRGACDHLTPSFAEQVANHQLIVRKPYGGVYFVDCTNVGVYVCR